MNPAPRRRSLVGLSALIGSFFFFAVCGPVGYFALVWAYEEEPEPVVVEVDAGTDAGVDAGVDAGPPVAEVIPYRGQLDETLTDEFGGWPYCRYDAVLSQITLEVRTQGTDAEGRPAVIGGHGSAHYEERELNTCRHDTLPPGPNELRFDAATYEGAELSIVFVTETGTPAMRATFRGTHSERALDGTLEIRRNDQPEPLLVFEMRARMRLMRAPE